MGELKFQKNSQVFRATLDFTILNTNGASDAVTSNIGITSPFTINTISELSLVGSQFQLPPGFYSVKIVSNTQGNNGRAAHAIRIYIGGLLYSITEPSDYKRTTESHNEAMTTAIDEFYLSSPSTFEFDLIQRSGGNGGFADLLDTSRIILVRR